MIQQVKIIFSKQVKMLYMNRIQVLREIKYQEEETKYAADRWTDIIYNHFPVKILLKTSCMQYKSTFTLHYWAMIHLSSLENKNFLYSVKHGPMGPELILPKMEIGVYTVYCMEMERIKEHSKQ